MLVMTEGDWFDLALELGRMMPVRDVIGWLKVYGLDESDAWLFASNSWWYGDKS